MTGLVRAVLLDLDDTLYPQQDFLDLAWCAVAQRGARLGLDRDRLHAELVRACAAGSARGGIIDEAVRRLVGEDGRELVGELVASFHAVRPAWLTPYSGVPRALRELRARVPIGLVTDGAVTGQLAKLAALELGDAFDAVVLGDAFGREFRKPHPRPFLAALEQLGVHPADAVMIGDRPDKDVAGAAGVGMRAIRVGTGEYRSHPDHPATWKRTAGLVDAVCALLPRLPAPRSGSRTLVSL